MGSWSTPVKAVVVGVMWGAAACGFDGIGSSGGGGPSLDGGGRPDSATDALADVDAEALATPPQTCAEILARTPGSPSEVYTVSPDGGDGGAADFPVRCDMTTAGGGWTLVGRELANTTQAFRYLGADSQNAQAIATGTASGLIGKRFIGKYTHVWIDWGTGSFIRFAKPAGSDVFDNAVNTSAPIADVTTSDSTLAGWFGAGGGAKLCVASRDSNIRPGDTSWAIKARSDNNVECGCSSMNWVGRGAYYSGVENSTSCGDYGGGWAGVRDTGVQKGGVLPTSETRIWIK